MLPRFSFPIFTLFPKYHALHFRLVPLTAQADALLRKDLAKFVSLYKDYGKDSVLLGALAYNCGPGVVNKSSILKKLNAGDRNIFKAYTSH